MDCPGGGIGRRAGLKILFAVRRVRVQFPSGAHENAVSKEAAFLLCKTQIKHFAVSYDKHRFWIAVAKSSIFTYKF